MNKSFLVRLFGFSATLTHGDTLVLDRWNWLKKRLPKTLNGEKLIDIGCGTGAFTIGAAKLGYDALGLSWDQRNQSVAQERAQLCNAESAEFDVLDVRELHTREDLADQFDVVVCCENVEHILNDRKLFIDMAACLKPGGRLLLTTPYYHYEAITARDNGPFATVENGCHVRRGYTKTMLIELCEQAGLMLEEQTFCSGFLSQKMTYLHRLFSQLHPILAWLMLFPFRWFIPLFDQSLTNWMSYPYFSIAIEAYKPRYAEMSGNRSTSVEKVMSYS
ncbi:class I SAM-dependent methyltransferase [Leptolyngbya sp. NIES-2104]|uniref:class I SAM-dependent methyltransferase n=1 Tax=Leptolyngbya sp. NIES-2104 TaxID=1552121 RepID=UPI0006EC9253|nr:class I SAM-dependent methyltransferase [Leptolyngbya sp. NIES-2104]GAP97593.1 3-demethylubiquinol 3-O-methyltransferase [Leptolyngbya sp. NIES-2104]